MEAEDNRNVDWVSSRGVWLFYVLLVAGFRLALWALPATVVSWPLGWTLTHIAHFLAQFFGFHWSKGTPTSDVDQGAYNELTFWEQLDRGRPWTATKKFFVVVPVILFMITCHATEYTAAHFVVNFPLFLLLVVSKLPEMHRVRIFGLNKTAGID
uniref:ORM1-like protein 3 n=1 Tax=Bicosoecida sp. CB-2014 TaxID=1486930 RepID=A0A7S1G9T5_9STRA